MKDEYSLGAKHSTDFREEGLGIVSVLDDHIGCDHVERAIRKWQSSGCTRNKIPNAVVIPKGANIRVEPDGKRGPEGKRSLRFARKQGPWAHTLVSAAEIEPANVRLQELPQ